MNRAYESHFVKTRARLSHNRPNQAKGAGPMKPAILALVCIWFAFSGADALAQQSDKQTALVKASISNLTGTKWRSNYALALKDFCSYMTSKVPRNTPAEDTWVEKETMDAMMGPGASQDRQNRLDNSAEYARFILQATFSKCVTSTNGLLKAAPGSKQEPPFGPNSYGN